MSSTFFVKSDITNMLAAVYAASHDSGERRGFLKVALLFGISAREITWGEMQVREVEDYAEGKGHLCIATNPRRLTG